MFELSEERRPRALINLNARVLYFYHFLLLREPRRRRVYFDRRHMHIETAHACRVLLAAQHQVDKVLYIVDGVVTRAHSVLALKLELAIARDRGPRKANGTWDCARELSYTRARSKSTAERGGVVSSSMIHFACRQHCVCRILLRI